MEKKNHEEEVVVVVRSSLLDAARARKGKRVFSSTCARAWLWPRARRFLQGSVSGMPCERKSVVLLFFKEPLVAVGRVFYFFIS